MTTVIKNGTVIDTKNDILIDSGSIVKVGPDLSGDITIDAKGLVILPGLIDCHVHFREPGADYKEDFYTGSCAAAAGGITTIMAMPNTNPPITTIDALSQERELAKKSLVNYGLYFCGVDGNSSEIQKASGICGVKIFMDVTTGNLLVSNDSELKKLFASHKRIAVHAEQDHVAKAISMVKETGKRLYLCHISSKEEVETIRSQKNEQVFAEATPHHLFLTKDDEIKLKGFGIMKPPLKTADDVAALWAGINDGTIDTVGTDHAPHTIDEKNSDKPPYGVPGCETMLPLLLDAVNHKKISLQKLVELTSLNPARIFETVNKGMIGPGYDADLVLVDMNMEKKVQNEELFTKCSWSPFNGKLLKGWPVMTIVNGNIVYNRGMIDSNHKGAQIQCQ